MAEKIKIVFEDTLALPPITLASTDGKRTFSVRGKRPPQPIDIGDFLRGPAGPQGEPGTGSAIVLTAATMIPGHRAISLDANGNAILADPTSADFAFAGISTSGANAGGQVTVLQAGLVEESTWNWIPLRPIFVSANGLLTQSPPSSGISQVVAVAQTATAIMIAPQTPIALTSLEFRQQSPAITWTIVHNLNRFPAITIIDSAGDLILANIAYPDRNTAVVTFNAATSGTAYLS
jgi:hypothetical protein